MTNPLRRYYRRLCTDPACKAEVGKNHRPDCATAICLHNGQQRLPHLIGSHDCGADVWTGYPAGTVEAVAAGLFVRRATADDGPLTGWVPCPADHPDARPDLDRVMRSGRWNPTCRTFEVDHA